MKKIKLSIPKLGWPLSDQPYHYIRQTPGNSGIWKDFKFYVNSNVAECDYWIIYDQLEKQEMCNCPRENTILITGEPPSVREYNSEYCNQFAHIITCHNSLTHRNRFEYIQGQMWFVNKTYDELSEIKTVKKSKQISLITSNKTNTIGHKRRYEFALALKEHFGDNLDLFGNGITPFEDKWDVLAPYKYSIVIENFSTTNYITEKLFDCFLAHTYPLYYGCNNISDYYDQRSFLKIDIEDIDGSIQIIKRILMDQNHYNSKIPFIIEAKNQTLNKYNFFPLIVNFIELNTLNFNTEKENITLKPESEFYSKKLTHIKDLIISKLRGSNI